MRTTSGWCALALLFVASVTGQAAESSDNQSGPFRVEEKDIRFHLLPAPELEIPLTNTLGAGVDGNLLLELLDLYGNQTNTSVTKTFHLEPGTGIEKIEWDDSAIPTRNVSSLGWYRLRYTLTAKAGSDFKPLKGIVQLGPLMADSFEVRLTAAQQCAPGKKYPVKLRVDNPKTGNAYGNVKVKVSVQAGEQSSTHEVITDLSGYATTEFDLPEHPSASQGYVTAEASRGTFSEIERIYFSFPTQVRLTLTTDKPIYQPGQTVHMRLLAFGPDNRAFPDAKIKVTIQSNGTEYFRIPVTTSQFGIASADWEIPQKLGVADYQIQATSEADAKGRYGQGWAQSQIRISRYELPSFAVTLKSDRTYYLPNQSATLAIRADYLFGQPVPRGKVKLQGGVGYWDFKKNQWVREESEAAPGELDIHGALSTTVTLKDEFNYSGDFWNERISAYVTDPSTGRTEQTAFDLRLSHKPVHLYLTPIGTIAEGASLQFYVTSSYADGTPASVEGTIEGAVINAAGAFDKEPDPAHKVELCHFHTNLYGIARVELPPLTSRFLVPNTDSYSYWNRSWNYYNYGYRSNRYLYYEGPTAYDNQYRESWNALFFLKASDAKGHDGQREQQLYVSAAAKHLYVSTDHTLYHPGQPIHIAVNSDAQVDEIIVNVSSSEGLLFSQAATVNRGRIELSVPYVPEFHGELIVTAYSIRSADSEARGLSGTTHIIYPALEELQVGVRMPHTEFRPGEVVNADLTVKTAKGEPVESALGILVFDQAVAERVRTDAQFGRPYGFSIYDYFSNYDQTLAGVRYRDLLALDSTKPFPVGLDLLAQAILQTRYQWLQAAALSEGFPNYSAAGLIWGNFQQSLHVQQLQLVAKILNHEFESDFSYPEDETEFWAQLKAQHVDVDSLVDPWGMAYRPLFKFRGGYSVLSLVSNGVDKEPDTGDDFVVLRFYRPYFAKTGKAIDAVINDYLADTGQYIRDYATLRDQLDKRGLDLDALHDPWGNAYRYTFEISGPQYRIQVDSPVLMAGLIATRSTPGTTCTNGLRPSTTFNTKQMTSTVPWPNISTAREASHKVKVNLLQCSKLRI